MQVTTVGLDIAKNVFQIHGVDAKGRAVLREKLRRSQLTDFFANLPVCVIGMESTRVAHFWARVLGSFGHSTRLIAPQFVKRFCCKQERTGPRARLFFARLRGDSKNAVDELALRDGIVPGNPTDLTFADCVHRFAALDCSTSALHRSEPEAGRNPLLDEAMILFNDVVQIRCGSAATSPSEFTGLLQFGDCAGIRWMPIHVDHSRAWSRPA